MRDYCSICGRKKRYDLDVCAHPETKSEGEVDSAERVLADLAKLEGYEYNLSALTTELTKRARALIGKG